MGYVVCSLTTLGFVLVVFAIIIALRTPTETPQPIDDDKDKEEMRERLVQRVTKITNQLAKHVRGDITEANMVPPKEEEESQHTY